MALARWRWPDRDLGFPNGSVAGLHICSDDADQAQGRVTRWREHPVDARGGLRRVSRRSDPYYGVRPGTPGEGDMRSIVAAIMAILGTVLVLSGAAAFWAVAL